MAKDLKVVPAGGNALPDVPPVAQPEGDPTERTVEQWADLKGHIIRKRVVRHRGDALVPHVSLVPILVHTGWPRNKLVTESEYVAAVERVGSIGVGGLGLHGPEAQEARRVRLAKKAAAISAARMAAAEGTKA